MAEEEVEGIIEAVPAGEAVPETIEAAAKIVVATKPVAPVKIVARIRTKGPPEGRNIVQFRTPSPTSCVIVITSMPTKRGTA